MRLPLSVSLIALAVPAFGSATPHELPFTYDYATLGSGAFEVEQYADISPVHVVNSENQQITTFNSALTTELEYGLTDRLELGLYFSASNLNGIEQGLAIGSQVPLAFDGVQQRLRLRLAEPGEWPVNVSLYGEAAEFTTEVELEFKLNLERRLGRILLEANLWGERDFYYTGGQSWVANPTLGASVQITPAIHLGIEYWMHAEFGDQDDAGFNTEPHHYLGPAFCFVGDRFWFSIAPYFRLDRWSQSLLPGEAYGRFWLRTVVGVEL